MSVPASVCSVCVPVSGFLLLIDSCELPRQRSSNSVVGSSGGSVVSRQPSTITRATSQRGLGKEEKREKFFTKLKSPNMCPDASATQFYLKPR